MPASLKRLLQPADQTRFNDASMIIDIGHLREVQLILCFFKNGKSFGNCLHHAVFNAVMHHLNKVSRSGPFKKLISVLYGEVVKKLFQFLESFFIAANHKKSSLTRSFGSARYANINKIDAALL